MAEQGPQTVHVILTDVNGYKNIFGHVLYSSKTEADKVAADALHKGLYDHVWVTAWKVV